MKTVCIDVGNTSTHYGVVEGREVSQIGDFPTAELLAGPSQSFCEALAPLCTGSSGIAFCSVVPAVNENLQASLADTKLSIFQLTHQTCRGLDLVYPKPEEIGQDRIANAIAA